MMKIQDLKIGMVVFDRRGVLIAEHSDLSKRFLTDGDAPARVEKINNEELPLIRITGGVLNGKIKGSATYFAHIEDLSDIPWGKKSS